MFDALFLGIHGQHEAGFAASGLVRLDDTDLGSLIHGLLERADRVLGLGHFPCGNELLALLHQMFDVRFDARIVGGALDVLAQVFYGCMLVWHI
jgi:hypothetical protein